jgi:hypothetical protein
MSKTQEVIEMAAGSIRLWVEQTQSIRIKAATPEGDPVELGVHEVNELIRVLRILKSQLD